VELRRRRDDAIKRADDEKRALETLAEGAHGPFAWTDGCDCDGCKWAREMRRHRTKKNLSSSQKTFENY